MMHPLQGVKKQMHVGLRAISDVCSFLGFLGSPLMIARLNLPTKALGSVVANTYVD